MNAGMDGWMGGWMDGWRDKLIHTLCDIGVALKKCTLSKSSCSWSCDSHVDK